MLTMYNSVDTSYSEVVGLTCASFIPSANLDELSKLTDTMYEKLLATGLHALPLDSEMLQLDCQATIKKSQEDVENSRATVQRVQINSVTLNKVMGLAPKK